MIVSASQLRQRPGWIAVVLVLATVVQLAAQHKSEAPSGLMMHIASPVDAQWIFTPSELRFESVLLHHGVTAHQQSWDASISVDGTLVGAARLHMSPISSSDRCLDPVSVRWRTGCRESDFNHWLRSHCVQLGRHTLDLNVTKIGTSEIVQSLRITYAIVVAPYVLLSFPAPRQHFACDGALSLMFPFDTDYEPSPDFYENGATIHGAAAIINQTRGTISDGGFVATPPLAHGVHRLRVALFDHAGSEITGSHLPLWRFQYLLLQQLQWIEAVWVELRRGAGASWLVR